MKLSKILFLIITVFVFNFLTAYATTIYLADVATGNGSGSDPSNRKAIQTYNNSGGANPGDTVSLGGTNVTELYMPSSGSAGNPITIYFEPNARLSQPNGVLIFAPRNYISINGGSNGIVENTATGTGLTYSNANSFFNLSGGSFMTISNLTFQNEYIHTNTNDSNPDIAANGGVYANGWGGSNYVVNCTFSNVGWCVSSVGGGGGEFLEVSNCSFVNYDHGIVPNGFTNILIANCTFGSTSNWDSTANAYHHDGIHYFDPTPYVNSYIICGNKFSGNWGNNNTAQIYTEQNPVNLQVFNNLFIQWPGNTLNNGFLVAQGNNYSVYNNTFLGQNVYNQNAIILGGVNTKFYNNIVNDVNTFVSISPTNGCIFSNNIYANWGQGGNSPWWQQAGINTFAAWQKQMVDTNSVYTNNVTVVNTDGSIPASSPAIGHGATLVDNGSGTATISSPTIAITPTSLNFGMVELGTTTNETFTVQNTGGGTLAGIASVSAPFSIVSGGSYSLTAGQSANITVSYDPMTNGTNTQTVTFSGGGGASVVVNGAAAIAAPQNLVPHAPGT